MVSPYPFSRSCYQSDKKKSLVFLIIDMTRVHYFKKKENVDQEEEASLQPVTQTIAIGIFGI